MIRHAKTRGNLNHEYIGSTDESLCEIGVEELKMNGKRYPHADYIYSSPLKRCIETAAIIYDDKKPIIENDLRECDFGDFEKMNYEQLKDREEYQRFIDSNGEASFPNGESKSQFSKRCIKAFEKIVINQDDGDTIAIICHGGTIMAVLHQYSNPHKDFYEWQAKNTQGFTFVFDTNIKKAIDIRRLQGES